MNDLLPEIVVQPSFRLNLSIITCLQTVPSICNHLIELSEKEQLPSVQRLISDCNSGKVPTAESLNEVESGITWLTSVHPNLKEVVDYLCSIAMILKS